MSEVFMILLAVLLSGSIWGWALPILTVLVIVISTWRIIKYKIFNRKLYFKKKNVINLIIILVVYTMNILIIAKLNPFGFWNIYVGIFVCFIICETIKKESFEKKYIYIILFLSLTSLFFWILSLFGVEIASNVINPGNGAVYRMNLLYIYRANENFDLIYTGTNIRNFGIFWEPGTFQAFINLALFFYIKNNNKIVSIKSITFILAIISTFSTTGYILLVINLFYYFYKNSKKNLLKRYIYIMIVFCIALGIFYSDTVQNKFSNDNESYNIRLNDNLSGIKAALVSPIWGLGYHSTKYTQVLSGYGITRNSSGVLILTQQFGIIFALWYTYEQCKHFTEEFNKSEIFFKIAFCVFLMIIFSTENLNQNQLFMIFVFYMSKKENNNLINNEKRKE